MNSASLSPHGRLAYLDRLRFLVALSLTPFYAAVSFTRKSPVYIFETEATNRCLPMSWRPGGPHNPLFEK